MASIYTSSMNRVVSLMDMANYHFYTKKEMVPGEYCLGQAWNELQKLALILNERMDWVKETFCAKATRIANAELEKFFGELE